MLIVTELAEAMEGERKGLMDDHLKDRRMAEVEMADAFIRVMDYMGGFHDGGFVDCEVCYGFYPMNNRGECLVIISSMVCQMYYFEMGCQPEELYKQATWVVRSIQKYCHAFGYDLMGAVRDKLEYNQQRADHKIENRLKEGGKKF